MFVHKIIEVSRVQFYDTSYVYHPVCPNVNLHT